MSFQQRLEMVGDPGNRSGSSGSSWRRSRRTTAGVTAARHAGSLSHFTRELGYAEQSVLTRSWRRWFDCGPVAYRRRIRSTQEAPT